MFCLAHATSVTPSSEQGKWEVHTSLDLRKHSFFGSGGRVGCIKEVSGARQVLRIASTVKPLRDKKTESLASESLLSLWRKKNINSKQWVDRIRQE